MTPLPPAIRVLLVDDHFFVREGLCSSLGGEPDITITGEAENSAEAEARYEELRPDVVLMDGRLPDRSGTETTRRILATHPAARIVILSIDETEEDIHRALEAGALAYLPKSVPRRELLHALREAAAGHRYLPRDLAARLRERRHRHPLTTREMEILHLVVAGLPNKNIAAELRIAENTVKIHLNHLFVKLDVQDRTSATVAAVRRGLVQLPDPARQLP